MKFFTPVIKETQIKKYKRMTEIRIVENLY